jgi:hypothetical protein
MPSAARRRKARGGAVASARRRPYPAGMAAKARKQDSSGDSPAAGATDVTSKDLAARLADPKFQRDIEQAVRELPPERAAELVAMLEASIKRRKLELYGYLAAAVIVLLGLIGGLLIMGSTSSGSFVGWTFFIPIGLAGLVMWLVGRKARAGQRRAGPRGASATRRSS